MKTDLELLELAAKAAGIKVRWHERDCLRVADKRNGFAGKWNPLTDDGDALRLMVMLGLSVTTESFFVRVYSLRDVLLVREEVGIDGYADTRRAIVRAAAAIGEEMK